jgi:hypothetical protein
VTINGETMLQHGERQETRHLRPRIDEAALSRVPVELLTASGCNVRIEFRIRRDTVELWHHEHLAAAFDRAVLSAWLHDPADDLVVDEARLHVDWQVDVFGRVAVTLSDVDAWTISPAELDLLYRRVTGAS